MDKIIRYFHSDNPVDTGLIEQPYYYEVTRDLIAYSFENTRQIVRDIALWGSDWSDVLEDVARQVPVLFVHGTENTCFTFDRLQAAAQAHSGIHVLPMPGSAELALYQAPEKVAEAMRSLLGKTPG